ncbi:MAG: hypothetical protein MJE77_46455 [Proteobacteria bacterium]|nr:hypothetical protein [Pseudomonadota bacterium]
MRTAGMLLIRSCYPFLTLIVIVGTVLWGPWVSLALAVLLWRINRWIG